MKTCEHGFQSTHPLDNRPGYCSGPFKSAPTETGWSKEFPTVIGFYFVRTEQYRELPAEFDGRAVSALHGARFFPDDLPHHHPEFLGPFTASDAEQLMELRKALECAVTRLEDNERWWHQARTLTTLTAFEKQAFEARAQTTRTTLDQLRAVLSPAKKAANT